MRINWLRPLYQGGIHNAFTDLIRFGDNLLCCFREAQTHISGLGRIHIVTCDKSGNKLSSVRLQLPSTDLRDPKLSIMPDGKLLLLAYARKHDARNSTVESWPISWFSSDGISWSSEKYFGHKFWWLWRVTWHKGNAYGLAYNRNNNAVNLYKGNPRRQFECIQKEVFSLAKYGKGYPNESDIQFSSDGVAHALLRRDADTCTAQWGISAPPYRKWKWYDLGEYIGGPVFCWKDEHTAIISGRRWNGHKPLTSVWSLDTRSMKLTLELDLPSAGDSSYPGLAWFGDELLLSYYSSHESGKSNIYLASLNVNG